ncbi:MAG: N-acetylneuraminate synthase family protein [Desulfobacteraceae bacterium]|nr:N-acetylneuraminate synthase family protein [Desulfobacteraceae bacterium]
MVIIGGKEISAEKPCFITFEAGPTHNSLTSAKELARHAAEAGADAIKFQIFDPDRLVADRKQLFSYEVLKDRETGAVETVTEPLYDILVRRCLSQGEWRELKAFCDTLGLSFFATIGFEEDIDLLVQLGCPSIKIASADVDHTPLIRKAARTGMCVQLDTGSATIGEVEKAVDVIRAEGNEDIIIHHCPSGYPAHLESINLKVIPTLKRMFSYPIAFSDHTPGWDMDIAAIALGAQMVEKTITLDRMTRSVEHVMSLEPPDMRKFIRAVRYLEKAMGQPRRVLHSAEREKRKAIRRSLFLRGPARKGQRLGDVDVEFRRPGFGIPPNRFEELQDACVNNDLPAGHMLALSDLHWS